MSDEIEAEKHAGQGLHLSLGAHAAGAAALFCLDGFWAWLGFALPMPASLQNRELALSLAEQPC